jgi:hypothetical protein
VTDESDQLVYQRVEIRLVGQVEVWLTERPSINRIVSSSTSPLIQTVPAS